MINVSWIFILFQWIVVERVEETVEETLEEVPLERL